MNNRTKWIWFEKEKRKLAERDLSAAEYEKAVRKLCRKYKV